MLAPNVPIIIGLSFNSWLTLAQYLRTDVYIFTCTGALPNSDLTAEVHVFECTPRISFMNSICWFSVSSLISNIVSVALGYSRKYPNPNPHTDDTELGTQKFQDFQERQ